LSTITLWHLLRTPVGASFHQSRFFAPTHARN
jgi:hypothetical protein